MSSSATPRAQHTRLTWPSLSPKVCSNSCPLNRWCHPTNISSPTPFSSCLQSFPASESFPMSQLFTSGGQNIGASVSASSEYSGLISLSIDWLDLFAIQGTLKSLLQHHNSKAIFRCSAFFRYIVFMGWKVQYCKLLFCSSESDLVSAS